MQENNSALQKSRQRFGVRPVARFAVTGIVALMILFLGLGAASPAIHKWIHRDANQPGHECAITQFQRQQFLFSGVAIAVVIVAASFSVALSLATGVLLPQVSFQLPPGRAPPFARSLLRGCGLEAA